jgi:hypothetical protein
MQKCSDQVNLECFIFIVLYENKLYYSIKALVGGH